MVFIEDRDGVFDASIGQSVEAGPSPCCRWC